MTKKYFFKSPIKRFVASLADAVGAIFLLPFKWLHPTKPLSEVKKILMIRNDSLGDVLMVLPVLRALNNGFPEAEIHWLAAPENLSILRKVRGISRLIPHEASWFSKAPFRQKITEACKLFQWVYAQHYDIAIDFRGDLRNILITFLAGIPIRLGYGTTGGGFLLTHTKAYPFDLHQVDVNLALLKTLLPDPQPETPDWLSFESDAASLLIRFPELAQKDRPLVMIHPGAGYPSKCWPIERFERIAADLLKTHQVLLIGTPKEKEEYSFPLFRDSSHFLDLRGKTSLDDLLLLLPHADLYVGNDSGPAHLAALLKVPSIVLFSGTNETKIWKPWSPQTQILQHVVPCAPCESRICPLGHHDCMRLISEDEVLGSIKTFFHRRDNS